MLDAIAQQNAILAEISARLGRLEQARAPRDASDSADDDLLVALRAGVGGGSTFRASDLVARCKVDEAFHASFTAADLTNVVDAGYWLRRYHGMVVDGRALDVVARDAGGAIWAFVVPM